MSVAPPERTSSNGKGNEDNNEGVRALVTLQPTCTQSIVLSNTAFLVHPPHERLSQVSGRIRAIGRSVTRQLLDCSPPIRLLASRLITPRSAVT